MNRLLLYAAILAAALSVACELTREATGSATPATGVTSSGSSATPVGTALSAPTIPDSSDQPGRCRYYIDLMGKQTGFALQLSPAAPVSGEVVRISGSGLPAGSYQIGVGVPQSGNVMFFPSVAVGTDGRLDAFFTIPSTRFPGTCVVAFANPGTGLSYLVAQPFVVR